MQFFDAVILGAGASGLMAAISAKQAGKSVLVLEKNSRPGLKILISGGGRCNFTNLTVAPEHFVSGNPKFSRSALSQYTNQDFVKWVKDIGIAHYEKTLGQLFCKGSSKEILQMLLDKLPAKDLLTSCEVSNIEKSDETFFIKSNRGEFQSSNLIIATGGLSFPKLGATDFGYKIAKQFGHSVTKLDPALDGFVLEQKDLSIFQDLAGVSCESVVTVGKASFHEPLLFTHKGLSGPSILKASLYWKANKPVTINFLPSIKDLKSHIHESLGSLGKKSTGNFLHSLLPKRLADNIATHLGIKDKRLAELGKKDLQALQKLVQAFTFVPQRTVGYDKAEVTRGGVDTNELSGKTLESQLVPGLFFVGEVVDVTGLLGGYNFQWAWSSGWVAGQNLR